MPGPGLAWVPAAPAPAASSMTTHMDDLLYLGLIALFFALSLIVLKGVDRL